jgi:hypothetical protein
MRYTVDRCVVARIEVARRLQAVVTLLKGGGDG